MGQFLFRMYFAVWPLFLGIFLPYLNLPWLGKSVNLFWGAFYGFGLLVADWMFSGTLRPPALLLGALVWPVFFSMLLYGFAGKISRAGAAKRSASLLVLFLSTFVIVSISRTYHAPYNAVPTFTKLMFVVW